MQMIKACIRLKAQIYLLFFFYSFADAACIANRPAVCGDPSICVSDRRPEGRADPNACLPPDVCAVLKKLAKKFGANKKIEVLSADRSRNCASRGGAGCNSLHAKCRGVDLYIDGINGNQKRQKTELLPFLVGQKPLHPIRYNIYCTGTVHIDNAAATTELPDSYDSCVEKKVWRGIFRKKKN